MCGIAGLGIQAGKVGVDQTNPTRHQRLSARMVAAMRTRIMITTVNLDVLKN